MKVYIASDHAGFSLKEELRDILAQKGYEVVDLGPDAFRPDDDYPMLMKSVGEALLKDPEGVGIVCGGSGQGEAMALNRMKGIRSMVWYGGTTDVITASRSDNNTTVLSIGARFVTTEQAVNACIVFLTTEASPEPRHKRRIGQLDEI
jgi:ribose 5-phosphate isomerase B